MGNNLSRVNCAEQLGLQYPEKPLHTKKSHKRIDKDSIGFPTDFRHTYHAGGGKIGHSKPSELHSQKLIMNYAEFFQAMTEISSVLNDKQSSSETKQNMSTVLSPTTTNVVNRDLKRRPLPKFPHSYSERAVSAVSGTANNAPVAKYDTRKIIKSSPSVPPGDTKTDDDDSKCLNADISEETNNPTFYGSLESKINAQVKKVLEKPKHTRIKKSTLANGQLRKSRSEITAQHRELHCSDHRLGI
ncbi:uncharacterized protein BYT42DRAFT_612704 [Radiomyces spectabilis]|uniref:uncharacterized protein n=1 Tax=Radiomyces spectabilis TaxID=64574 RepID=UPI00221FCF56|nr:uncharacterized protein BYT42DRAFT_612704 [Radiomyces spectabilis]KAI8385055.1 hypothetical protein BYT42DRAFT_612704 [Radiomyces spectabilis]